MDTTTQEELQKIDITLSIEGNQFLPLALGILHSRVGHTFTLDELKKFILKYTEDNAIYGFMNDLLLSSFLVWYNDDIFTTQKEFEWKQIRQKFDLQVSALIQLVQKTLYPESTETKPSFVSLPEKNTPESKKERDNILKDAKKNKIFTNLSK